MILKDLFISSAIIFVQSVLKLIAVHFQFTEDGMDIITCPRTLKLGYFSGSLV